MKSIEALPPHALYRRCEPEQLPFATTAELAEGSALIGQERAMSAVEFGVGMRADGYNLFVLGSPGTGRHTLLSQYLEAKAAAQPQPSDWCYVNNFQASHRPKAMRLPPGRGVQLRADMEQLVEELRALIPATLESDEYRARAQQIESEIGEREASAFGQLGEEAGKQGLALLRTPSGFSFAPVKNNEVMDPDEFNRLPADEQERLRGALAQLQEQLEKIVRQAQRWHKERRERTKALRREIVSFAVGHAMTDLREKYADLPEVGVYLAAVQEDAIEHIDDFRKPAESTVALLQMPMPEDAALRRYRVNLLVDHSTPNGAPVVFEIHPTYQNLIGRVEHVAQIGALVTDFTLIKPGALHLANGGYVLLDVYKLFAQPYAWEGLKRALLTRFLRIESLGQMFSLISTVSLEPEPIPLDIKVVLFGDRLAYYLLCAYDPDFTRLFKVAADFEDEVARTAETSLQYARLIAAVTRQESLRPLDRAAVARVIEWCSRLAGDAEKLSTQLQSLADLLREADYWAAQAGRATVQRENVDKTIQTQIFRLDRLSQQAQEAILRNILMIDTDGEVIGQVNGLSVASLGSFTFAHPTRITATTRLGEGEVVDIQREVNMGGAIHSKGVLTLAAFLAMRYSRQRPLSLAASLTFEQTYAHVDGDSASTAELCAILSSLAEAPVRQGLAVTGSVNQWGQVQAIGAVNEKIEGFFDICTKRGLNGKQGVLIPTANVVHLMLREDVVEAVRQNKFSIYAIDSVDDAMTLLTGVAAGAEQAAEPPGGSLNARIAARLEEFAQQREHFGKQPAAVKRRHEWHRQTSKRA